MTPQTQTSHPKIPWRAIKGMRNIFAHDYGKLDRSLVWNTVARDFTMLESFCLAYAKEHCLDI